MKYSNLALNNVPVPLSCEFFPAGTDKASERLNIVRQELSVLPFSYFSVTYGAGGSKVSHTMDLVKAICGEKSTLVMPHITCVAMEKVQIIELLDEYYSLGIRHIMALRGDMPSGSFSSGKFLYAKDLVELIRERWGDDAHIVVAAYPEMHPRARSPEDDIKHFIEKFQAGANEAVTQYFFNADAYSFFCEAVAKYQLDIPIVPGIMPITNFIQLARFSDGCGAEIPRWIRKRLEAYQNDLTSLHDFGADVIAGLCEKLLAAGAPALHFYSMNRSDGILSVATRLGWIA